MNLSPMRFKEFVWPHNPRVYSITYQRKMGNHKIPLGRYALQSMGLTRRVFRGEGEFVGEGAYDTFKALATVFYEETPGPLIHPVWMATNAWFVGLELEQEPRSDYVRYSFEFWEVVGGTTAALTARSTGKQGKAASVEEEAVYHRAAAGESLWAIARSYGTTVEALLSMNPGIANPNRLTAGQKVRVA